MGKAKRGGVFGMIRGSVGPATYSIGKNGAGKKQQIIREKPVEVANPRTRAQAIQRMKMVPIMYAMGLLSDIVDHSFKGVQEGWPSKRYFTQLALKELDVPFITKGSLSRAIGGYQISSGTLGNTTAHLANVDDVGSAKYAEAMPFTNGLNLPINQFGNNGTGVTYAALSQAILNANPTLQNGDEIAVLAFVIEKAGAVSSVRLEKRRMLIDTNFTTETPDEWIVEEEGRSYDLNVAYALSQWNDFDFKTWISSRLNSFQTNKIGIVSFQYFFGLIASNANGCFITTPVHKDYTGDALGDYVPHSAAQGNTAGFTAAAALIISRQDGSGWNYTVSDICLNEGYLAAWNTQTLMEQAIASYMSDSVVDTSSSDYYLQLTRLQYEQYDTVSFDATGSVTIESAATAVKATLNGRIDPVNGKVILFVDADGYLTMEGIETNNAIAFRGFRWKNASTNAYLNPANYVKAEDITNANNVEFATEVF